MCPNPPNSPNPSSNPFRFGAPVRGEDFLDRRRALRRIANTLSQGGSAILSAEPRMGKTSLLLYLQEQASALWGHQAERWVFRYLDGHTFGGWDVPRFWREALHPCREVAPAVARAYAQAEAAAFDAQALEGFFQALREAEGRLVLLLDEFDAAFHEAGLHHQRFYGPLRSLASRCPSLSLVIATRQSVTEMNEATKDFAAGSPYFNFAQEVALGPFPQRDVDALLAHAGSTFSAEDRAFLRQAAGAHPYLLQVAAYHLWEAYHPLEGEPLPPPEVRREAAARELLNQARATLTDTWRRWTPAMRLAFAIVALDHMPRLLPGHDFDLDGSLLRQLTDFQPELDKLERLGFLKPDDSMASGYAPQAEVMLWHLAEELTQALRGGQDEVARWLIAQEWDGLLKKGEKEALLRALKDFGSVVKTLLRLKDLVSLFST